MKVKHLIDQLKSCNPDSIINIKVRVYDESLADRDSIVSDDIVEVVEYEDQYDTWVVISGNGGCLVY